MNETLEQIPLLNELLAVMRNSGCSQQLREPFITARALLLALLDDKVIGEVIAEMIPRDKIMALPPSEDVRMSATRLPETGLPAGEKPAMPRYDTLAFKLPEGTSSVWLSKEAFSIFIEGANRVDSVYLPEHLPSASLPKPSAPRGISNAVYRAGQTHRRHFNL